MCDTIELMKTLKLDHELAQAVLAGEKHATWRVNDEKDLSVNDDVELIDKVNPSDMGTWQVIGHARIDQVTEKRLGDLTDADLEGHEQYESKEVMYEALRGYYGPSIGPETPAKLIWFTFEQYDMPKDPAKQVVASKRIKLFADGGSRGNPGPSASGFVLLDANDSVIKKSGVYLGITTNNQAEYQALKLGLEESQKLGFHEVDVFMDSMLVVNQMKGIFKVKNRDLWPIHQSIKDQVPLFKHITFTHVPRELNKLADGEVNEILDAEASKNTVQ